MKRKVQLIVMYFLCFCVSSIARAQEFYFVKKSETLSAIAAAHLHGNLYGPTGQLKKLIAFNPQIQNPNLVFIGQKIYLSSRNALLPKPALAKKLVPVEKTIAETSSPKTELQTSREPSSAEMGAPTEPPPTYSEFNLKPSFALAQIKASDNLSGGMARLISKSDYALDAFYEAHLATATKAVMGVHFASVAILQPNNPQKSLSGDSQWLEGFALGLRQRFSPTFEISLLGRYQSELFVRAISTNIFTTDAVPVPSLQIEANWDFFQSAAARVGAMAQLAAEFAGSSEAYNVHSGGRYGGEVYLAPAWRKNKNFNFQTSAGYFLRRQDTDFIRQTQSEMVFSIKLEMPLDHSPSERKE